jgi:preprotein translocase SecE subunit
MASVTKANEENRPVTPPDDGDGDKGIQGTGGPNDVPEKDDVRALDTTVRQTGPRAAGLLTIYKKGQGYWTRMGTLIGAGVVIVMLSYTLYEQIPASFFARDAVTGRKVGMAVAGGFLLAAAGVALWLMNKPTNVDFLIATDSEMKKVNWTSRKELIGSSKVVILFMFLIAAYLFINDIVWGYLMYWISVLKTPPLG